MADRATAVRVGIDVGGTFTDVIAWSPGRDLVRLKVATTPRAPELGALAALDALLETSPIVAREIGLVVHASTIATNALLGQMHLTLPRVAFVTTAGFRDLIEIGRQNRSAIYDLNVKRPAPLARREDRFVVHERREADGRASRAVDPAEVDAIARELAARGIETVAIGLLHAHVDDAHEVAIGERLRERLPAIAISRSADLVREFREYERFSTAVVNAALLPAVRGYLDRFAAGVRDAGVTTPIFAMRSDGGMASIEFAAERPAALIESGPAAGVIAAAFLARTMGIERVLSFDMGGTTAKAGTILAGTPEIATEFEAAGATHSGRARKGSGYPVRFPFVDLAEVSAGGGTIAWLDAARTLHVGPLSAGADPGPAAYGRGTAPTVTDANVVLGRLNPRALLGGTFPVDARAASRALATIAEVAHGDVFEAAAAVLAIVDSEMAKVLRIVSVERGHDPRTFALVAFGGGGPLHACGVASDIGVRDVVIPKLPGLFSAFGLLAADVRVATSRTFVAEATPASRTALVAIFEALQREGERALAAQAIAPAGRAYLHEVDMRYAGQSFELTVPYGDVDARTPFGDSRLSDSGSSERSFSEISLAASVEVFHAAHERRYGYAARDEAVEIVTVRVIALGRTEKPRLEAAAERPVAAPVPDDARIETRDVWDGTRFVATPIFEREKIPPGGTFDGPAIVEQYDTTTYVAPGWRATVDAFGNLVLENVHA
jgi:N-methylhydantoinase A